MLNLKYLLTYNESIRNEYEKSSPSEYYRKNKHIYQNPHSDRVKKSLDFLLSKLNPGYFLDLECGDGVVSEYLKTKGLSKFKGCDPNFKDIYQEKIGKECMDLSFEDIAKFGLNEKFDTIICSYSLHLCDVNFFNLLLYQLSISCNKLVVISPSKYPSINETYFKLEEYSIIERTHIRIYSSNLNKQLSI